MFDPEKEILQYIKTGTKAEKIVALFMKAKNMVPENQLQLDNIIKRHLSSTMDLECYSLKKIIRTMKYLVDNADFKWVITTLLKYIDEDMDELDGKEAIIILHDGERVYDIERLSNLEKGGRIYYEGTKWKEV